MKLPCEAFIKSIEEKKVYYFSSTRLNTDEPHHYICIKKSDNDILILTVCTSKFDTVKNYVERAKLPNETLVWISPVDANNPFTKDTYVNCNTSFTYTLEEFREMYESDTIKHSGEINDGHYFQILDGLHASPLIDKDTKNTIPKSEQLGV